MKKMGLVQYFLIVGVLMSGLTNAQNMQISGGHRHTIVLCNTGMVMHAGERGNNQDGTGAWSGNNLVLTNVPGVGGAGILSNIKMVDAGSTHHTIALTNTGEVIAFGNDYVCQLGQGSAVYPANPVYVKGVGGVGNLTGISSIVGSSESSYAIKSSDGGLIAWGNNSQGQLGVGTVTASECTPLLVNAPLNSGVIQVDGGDNFTLALKNDGTVYGMGENLNGQLGIGNNTDQSLPQQVMISAGVPLTNVVSISCGDGMSYAIRSDGTLWTWGHNGWGQLGLGNCTNTNYAMQAVTGSQGHASGFLQGVKQVAGGNAHAVVVLNDGNVYTMGSDQYGQLGDGAIGGTDDCGQAIGSKNRPYKVASLSGINAVSDGDFWSFAITAAGVAYSWGQNNYGQLSINNTTNTPTPTLMSMGTCTVLPVTLTSFKAKWTSEYSTLLRWTTVSEENSLKFEIERSTDGINFINVATVASSGNSSEVLSYDYTDFISSAGNGKLYYRLKIIDQDGSFTYSSIEALSLETLSDGILVYPNPVLQNAFIKISFLGKSNESIQYSLFDMSGKVLREVHTNSSEGKNEFQLSTEGLSVGIYVLKIIHYEQVKEYKIIIQ